MVKTGRQDLTEPLRNVTDIPIGYHLFFIPKDIFWNFQSDIG